MKAIAQVPIAIIQICLYCNRVMNYNYHLLFKYIMVGDASCGKSSLLMRFIENKFIENYESTLGVEFGSKIFNVGSTIIKTMIWDTAGQQSFKSIIRSYYKCAIVAILVFDITNPQSFLNLDRWIEEIKTHGNESIRMVLVGNKLDLGEKQRLVSKQQSQQYALSRNMPYYETSAKNGTNVQDLFMEPAKNLILDIENKKIIIHSNNQNIGIKIGNPEGVKTQRQAIQISVKTQQKQACKC